MSIYPYLWRGLDDDAVCHRLHMLNGRHRHSIGSRYVFHVGHHAPQKWWPESVRRHRQGREFRRLLQVHGHLSADGGITWPAFVLHSWKNTIRNIKYLKSSIYKCFLNLLPRYILSCFPKKKYVPLQILENILNLLFEKVNGLFLSQKKSGWLPFTA